MLKCRLIHWVCFLKVFLSNPSGPLLA